MCFSSFYDTGLSDAGFIAYSLLMCGDIACSALHRRHVVYNSLLCAV